MSKTRLVITAIEIEGRKVAEVARTYGVPRSWIYELLSRYRAEGDTAFEPRSRRPKTSLTAIAPATIDLIIRLRKHLTEYGMDAGPDTIACHLQHHHGVQVSTSTIARTLTRQSLVIPEPKKRPKASYIRFAAEQPNETWQSDFTHYRLTDGTPAGTDMEILTWLDDHSRYALHVSAHPRISGRIVLDTFRDTAAQHGYTQLPATPRHLREGRALPADPEEVARRTTHPAHHHPAAAALIDTFVDTYNNARPHSSLPHRATPATAYHNRPKTGPSADRTKDSHARVLSDKVDPDGKLSLRLNGQMHHIGVGAEHARTQVLKLVDGLHVRIINAATGELLRELTLDPTKNYQPLGRPPGPKPKTRRPDPSPGSGLSGIS